VSFCRKAVVRMLHPARCCVLALVFCAFMSPCFAVIAPAELSPGPDRISLDRHVFVLKDPNGVRTIEDVISPPMGERFVLNDTGPVNVTGDPAKTWGRFTLRNPGSEAREKTRWVLELNCSVLDLVELYVPDPTEKSGYRLIKGSRSHSGHFGNPPFRNYTYGLDPPPDGEATYFLRLGSFGPTTVPLVLRTNQAFAAYAIYDHFAFGLIYGVMFSMVLYNLFIFFSLRNRIYLTYVLYMLSFIFYFLLFNGHVAAMANLGSRSNQVMEWIFLGGSIFFSITFCQQFFDTRLNTPTWHWVLVFFKVMALAIMLLGMLEQHEAAAVAANAAGALGPINLIIIAVIRWRQGFETAKYYILANLSFMFGTWFYVFWTIGALPVHVHSNMIFTLGPAIEAVLLSFALADRIRVLEKEKIVLARDQALYKKASETDGLTGLYNKNYLMQRLEMEVRESAEGDRPLSFIIIDVDNFKTYNDTYGHPEGDAVLRSLAEVILAEIREQDAGCRYGGEEFTVVFPEIAGAQALKAAERIRQAFAGLTLHPGGGPGVSVTVSIGLAQFRPGEGPDDLIRRADQALYQAKKQGKNRVVTAPG